MSSHGRPRDIRIAALRANGVRVVGRVGRIHDGVAQFSGGLANTVRLADLKLDRLLDRFDSWAETGMDGLIDPVRAEPTVVDEAPLLEGGVIPKAPGPRGAPRRMHGAIRRRDRLSHVGRWSRHSAHPRP